MAIKLTANNSQLKIFGTEQEILRASRTLLRLGQLDCCLSEDGIEERGSNAKLLSEMWGKVKEHLEISFEKAKQLLQTEFRYYVHSLSVYSLEYANIQECISFGAFVERSLNDLTSVQIPPIKKSHRGNKGPTFLVSYPKYKKDGAEKRIEYVLKWTSWNEIICNRIYGAFLHALEKNREGYYNICVPQAGGFDCKTRLLERKTGEQILLSEASSKELHHNFLKTSQIYTKKKIDDSQQVMFSEKVRGENLFDFVKSKYELLTLDQKKSLFRSLAIIAFLDVLMGDRDRMVQIDFSPEQKEYCLEMFEANFGNIMISWPLQSQENPTLYAIDNGIDDNLAHSPMHQEKYIQFIKALFNTPQWERIVADNMVRAFRSTLVTQVDDEGGNVLETKEQLKAFSKDLSDFAGDAFMEGLSWMNRHLFHQPKENLPLHHRHSFPAHIEVYQAVKQRFEVFQHSRIKS